MSRSAGTGYETANNSRYFRDVLGNRPHGGRRQTYSVRIVTVPIHDNQGCVHVALSLYQLPRELTGAEVMRYADRLVAASKEVTAVLATASAPDRT